MAAKTTFSDDRRALDRILREVAKLRTAAITVGVHGDGGDRTDGELTNVQVAAIHEFGSGNVPERSFLRATVDADPGILQHAKTVADKVAHGAMTARVACESVGVVTIGAVQRTIKAGIAPALAPATIEKRLEKGAHGGGLTSLAGATTPLVDTGQLWRSIQYQVTGAKGWGRASAETSAGAGGGE